MRSRISGVAVVTLLLAAMVAGCRSPEADGTTAEGASPGDGPLVMATTSIWGDMAARVLGDAGRVEVVMEGGQDPHSFRLSAQQLGRLGEADLVVANGLGLEAGMDDALDELAAAGIPVVEVASALDPIAAGEESGHADDHDDEDAGEAGHGELDPHVWLDPVRMAQSGHVIAAALHEVVPGPWEDRAEQLEADLDALHGRVEEILAAIPDECRVLVANHDAMRYLAVRYDLEVGATVLPGFSTDVQPSARDFAAVVELVADTGVPAVFVEDTASTRLADTLADELGGAVTVVTVPVASLGPAGSPTDGYEGLVTTLATKVAEALATC